MSEPRDAGGRASDETPALTRAAMLDYDTTFSVEIPRQPPQVPLEPA